MPRRTLQILQIIGLIALGLIGVLGYRLGWFSVIFGDQTPTVQTTTSEFAVDTATEFAEGTYDGTTYQTSALQLTPEVLGGTLPSFPTPATQTLQPERPWGTTFAHQTGTYQYDVNCYNSNLAVHLGWEFNSSIDTTRGVSISRRERSGIFSEWGMYRGVRSGHQDNYYRDMPVPYAMNFMYRIEFRMGNRDWIVETPEIVGDYSAHCDSAPDSGEGDLVLSPSTTDVSEGGAVTFTLAAGNYEATPYAKFVLYPPSTTVSTGLQILAQPTVEFVRGGSQVVIKATHALPADGWVTLRAYYHGETVDSRIRVRGSGLTSTQPGIGYYTTSRLTVPNLYRFRELTLQGFTSTEGSIAIQFAGNQSNFTTWSPWDISIRGTNPTVNLASIAEIARSTEIQARILLGRKSTTLGPKITSLRFTHLAQVPVSSPTASTTPTTSSPTPTVTTTTTSTPTPTQSTATPTPTTTPTVTPTPTPSTSPTTSPTVTPTPVATTGELRLRTQDNEFRRPVTTTGALPVTIRTTDLVILDGLGFSPNLSGSITNDITGATTNFTSDALGNWRLPLNRLPEGNGVLRLTFGSQTLAAFALHIVTPVFTITEPTPVATATPVPTSTTTTTTSPSPTPVATSSPTPTPPPTQVTLSVPVKKTSTTTTTPTPTATTTTSSPAATSSSTTTRPSTATPTRTATTSSTSTPTPTTDNPSGNVTNPELSAGDVVTIDLADATIGTVIQLDLSGTPLGSQTITTNPARLLVTIPQSTSAGTHELTLSSLDWTQDLQFTLEVTADMATTATSTDRSPYLGWILGFVALGIIGLGAVVLIRRRNSLNV